MKVSAAKFPEKVGAVLLAGGQYDDMPPGEPPPKGKGLLSIGGIPMAARTLDELLANCDAVYVASPHYTHYEYAKAALLAGKHVLAETPFVLHLSEAEELFSIAGAKERTLMVAHKTAYCPAFRHLVTMLKSGVIGKIVDINASVTTLTDEAPIRSAARQGALGGA